MDKSSKDKSPLAQSVLALESYFAELERLGNKITASDMKSEFDFEQARRWMERFSECGEEVAVEVQKLATLLGQAQARAEELARAVSEKAGTLQSHHTEKQKYWDEFHALTATIQELSQKITQLRRPEGEVMTTEQRAELHTTLANIGEQLAPLIDQASRLRKDAQKSRLKTLEQNADSLTQTLQSVKQKLSTWLSVES